MKTLTTKEELALLRSAVVGFVGRDKEGTYRPAFVREMLGDLKRTPTHSMRSREQFLNAVRKAS